VSIRQIGYPSSSLEGWKGSGNSVFIHTTKEKNHHGKKKSIKDKSFNMRHQQDSKSAAVKNVLRGRKGNEQENEWYRGIEIAY